MKMKQCQNKARENGRYPETLQRDSKLHLQLPERTHVTMIVDKIYNNRMIFHT